MAALRIIPAIDLIEGKCVRLEKGDYARKTVYRTDPLEVAKEFEDHGLKYLHLVDLDGAKAGQLINLDVVEKICSHTQLKVDVGGGIKTEADLRAALNAGAQQVNIGSLAVKDPETFSGWLEEFGGEKIILSADVKEKQIAIHGWQETTALHIFDFIEQYIPKGIQTVTCTDISRDGMLSGTSIELYKEIQQQFPDLKLIASGGVACMKDVEQVAELGLFGVIIGKAIYEGKIRVEELGSWAK